MGNLGTVDPSLLPMPWKYPPPSHESYLLKPDGKRRFKIGILWSDGVVKPHPPVLIAGGGEQMTLRAVARLADASNLVGGGVAEVRHKLSVLRGHCDAAGRDYGTIEKTSLNTAHIAPGQMTAGDVIAQCKALRAIGVDHAIVNMPNVHELKPLEVFAKEIIPELAGI